MRPAAMRPFAACLTALSLAAGAGFAPVAFAQDDTADDRPPELRRALDLLDEARTGGAASRAGTLDEAEALLAKFVADDPESPFAGEAAVRRGDVLQARASAAVRDAERGGDDAARAAARDLAEEAQRVYEDAAAALERQLKGAGTFAENDGARAERETAIARLIRARIEAARSLFLRARTHPRDDPRRAQLLDAANEPLEALRGEYRNKIGALAGRLLQGQIYETLAPPPEVVGSGSSTTPALAPAEVRAGKENLTRALAMYDEVRGQQDPSDATREVREALDAQRAAAQRWRTGILNHPLRAEYRLAADEAAEWLGRNGRVAETEAGLGVRLERAKALEALAAAADGEGKEGLLRDALREAGTVAAADTPDRGEAVSLIARVRGASGGRGGEPRDFRSAYDLALGLVRDAQKKSDELAALRGDERAAAEAGIVGLYADAADLLERAVALADRGTDRETLDRVRSLLALAELRRGHPYEAAVLGEYVFRNFAGQDRDVALTGGLTAAAAWASAFQTRPASNDGAFEVDRLTALADEIAAAFPDSSQADDARLTAANLLRAEGRFAEAAERFLKVPRDNPGFAESRLLAGDALWRAYIESVNADPPATEEAQLDLKARAEAALVEGVAATESDTAPEAPSPVLLTDAKRTLAQLYNRGGDYAQAAEILTAEPHPVTEAVSVGDGRERPARGVTSAEYAAFVYRQLLRARVGLQQIEPAMEAMRSLEAIGGAGNTGTFVKLGREIREEIDRLPGGDRRDEVLASFEQFLDRLSSTESGQTYASLLWIAETYGGLADGLPDGSGRAAGYRDRAAATLRTLADKLDEPGFVPPGPDGTSDPAGARAGVNLLLAENLAAKGDHAAAYDLVTDVLAGNENALNAQTTAAGILADWGASDGKADPLRSALRGEKAKNVWGWGQLASKLSRAAAAAPDDAGLRDLANDAKLKIPATRRELALTLPPGERDPELGRAVRDLVTFATTTPADRISEATRDGMEELYRTLQGDLGVRTFDPLPVADAGAPADAPPAEPAPPVAEPEPDDPGPVAAPPADGGLGVVGPAVIVLLALAAAAGVWWMMSPGSRSKKKRSGKRSGGRRRTTVGSLPDVAPIPAAPRPQPAGAGSGFPDVTAAGAKTRRESRTPEERAAAKKRAARGAAAAGGASRAGASRAGTSGSGTSGSGKGVKPAATPSAPPTTPEP